MNDRELSRFRKGLARRYAAERRFRFYGITAIALALSFLALLFASIFGNGYSAFQQTKIRLDVDLSAPEFAQTGEGLSRAGFSGAVKRSLSALFPGAVSRAEKRELFRLVSPVAPFELREMVEKQPGLAGRTASVWLSADDEVDQFFKGKIARGLPQSERRISDLTIARLDRLAAENRIEKQFNVAFFTHGDSREPEQAEDDRRHRGEVVDVDFDQVGEAVFRRKLLEVNRGGDADRKRQQESNQQRAQRPHQRAENAGLLGLAVFINFFGLPRSTALVGGIVLSLMTLPTIIIASRASIKSVPPSIREAALGMGASHTQAVLHHVLPLAMPGMLTGSIIGMAQALGESAPLLMIGMVAFIVDVPASVTDPSTALPVQIYQWAKSPERAFVERTAAAIMVLLTFLVVINIAAIILRKRFERRW